MTINSSFRVESEEKKESHEKRCDAVCACVYKSLLQMLWVCMYVYRKCGILMTNLNETLVQYIINTYPPKQRPRGKTVENR